MDLIFDRHVYKDCPDIVLQLLVRQKIGPKCDLKIEGESVLHCACYMGDI
jgi:hypothetical protein